MPRMSVQPIDARKKSLMGVTAGMFFFPSLITLRLMKMAGGNDSEMDNMHASLLVSHNAGIAYTGIGMLILFWAYLQARKNQTAALTFCDYVTASVTGVASHVSVSLFIYGVATATYARAEGQTPSTAWVHTQLGGAAVAVAGLVFVCLACCCCAARFSAGDDEQDAARASILPQNAQSGGYGGATGSARFPGRT